MAIVNVKYKTPQRRVLSFEEAKKIASTVIDQLGGRRFIDMTGAKNFGANQYTTSFKIMRNAKGVQYVRITLNSLDTYDLEFIKFNRKEELVTVSKFDGAYNDMLQDIFTQHTGLYTSL